jgi:hypothetical protein
MRLGAPQLFASSFLELETVYDASLPETTVTRDGRNPPPFRGERVMCLQEELGEWVGQGRGHEHHCRQPVKLGLRTGHLSNAEFNQ